jgi:hypothetical protein
MDSPRLLHFCSFASLTKPRFRITARLGIFNNVLDLVHFLQPTNGRPETKVLHMPNLFQFRIQVGFNVQNDVRSVFGIELVGPSGNELDVATVKGSRNGNGNATVAVAAGGGSIVTFVVFLETAKHGLVKQKQRMEGTVRLTTTFEIPRGPAMMSLML